MRKSEILMNKPVYLGFLILELSTILMHQFPYEYIKPKYSKKAKCYCIHKKVIFTKILQKIRHFKLWIRMIFNWKAITKSEKQKVNYVNERPIIRKIMIKFVGLTVKTCSYLIDDSSEENKAKETKKCVIKRKLKIENLFKSNTAWK